MNRRSIGLALGGGAARGWSHIAVLRELDAQGIRPDVIAGTSIGALVGAAYALDRLEVLEQWVRGMRWPELAGYFDIRLEGGLIAGERLMTALADLLGDADFSACRIPFAAVATDLETGQECWLREGRVLDAVRASIAMPILFAPVWREQTWLVDGGLVNPVPVSVCRAMGARHVIAVSLLEDALERETLKPASSTPENNLLGRIQRALTKWLGRSEGPGMPSILDVMGRSVNIMELRIGRSRLAGDPPDVLLMPRMPGIGLLDFHRAEEAMQAGREAMARAAPALHDLIYAIQREKIGRE